MDLFNQKLEMRVLRTLTDPAVPEKKRLALLGRLDKRLFSNTVTKAAYARLAKEASAESHMMDWDDLLSDPRVNTEVRDELSEYDDIQSAPIQKWKSMLTTLDRYRKRRELVDMTKKIAEVMEAKDEDVDEDQLLVDAADRLNAIKMAKAEHKVITFGKNGNALAFAKKTLTSPSEKMLLTGYRDYDERNGGLPTCGVVLIGATTSGGKSVFSQNLLHRMAKANKGLSVLKITLEMTCEQEMNRMLSMYSGVPLWKIKNKKINEREERAVLKAAASIQAEYERNGSSYSYTSPDRGMSVDDVLCMSSAYGTNLTCIDYVGLLEDANSNDQWKALSEVVRKCKIHATNTNSLYVILVQVDSETTKIRYSKGMLEHADVALVWNYSDPEVRATRKIPVGVVKARDGELFELPLEEEFEIMRVGDDGDRVHDPDETDEMSPKSKEGSDGYIGE